MPSIRDQRLLYHLTSLRNLDSILDQGLQPRSALRDFHDVADAEILQARRQGGLDQYVPFHWFSRNPFDGRVQKDRPHEHFVLLTVRRELARARNWRVIPRHPLAHEEITLYDYETGFALIDWTLMDSRNYNDPTCKSVCMAECLAPGQVGVADFFMLYAATDVVARAAQREVTNRRLTLDVSVNSNMFCL